MRYILLSDEDKKMIFQHKNPVVRFMRIYEDRIEVDYSENPVIVSGLRRDVDRLARRVQQLMQKETWLMCLILQCANVTNCRGAENGEREK